MYIGGVFNGPQYLNDRIISYTQTPVTAIASLDAAKTFYTRLQDKLAAAPTNAQSRVQWGGVFIKCNSVVDDFYYINIDAADLAASTWWNLENCNFQAHYVLNIVGTSDVLLQGGDFPTITERVIFNIVGSNRYTHFPTPHPHSHVPILSFFLPCSPPSFPFLICFFLADLSEQPLVSGVTSLLPKTLLLKAAVSSEAL